MTRNDLTSTRAESNDETTEDRSDTFYFELEDRTRAEIEDLLYSASREARKLGRSERSWSRASAVLGFGGAAGVGVGGVAAIAGELSGGARIVVAVLAFIGAGLSAAGGGCRSLRLTGPQKRVRVGIDYWRTVGVCER